MEKVLTVSIAAYNVEKFLSKTLDSFVSIEHMEEIEVLIINDGSKDNTLNIAKKYEERYPNTFVAIDKQNGGHGSTINKAINVARGKYLCLVDGDDWVDTEQFYSYVQKLKTTNSDLIVNKFNTVDNVSGAVKEHEFSNVVFFKEYTFDNLPCKEVMGLSAITIRTSILKENNINIDEHCFYVDMEYISYPVPFIETIIFMPFIVYQYRVNQSEQSVSKKSLLSHYDNHLLVNERLFTFLRKFFESPKYSLGRELYLNRVIYSMSLNGYTIRLLKKYGRYEYESIKKFDKLISNTSKNIYKMLEKKIWIKAIRHGGYAAYLLISTLMKIKIK